MDKKEFRLAQICGLNLIVHAEELPALLSLYERNGYFDEIISLMEGGLGLERAHMVSSLRYPGGLVQTDSGFEAV